jgi:hypothetical protein
MLFSVLAVRCSEVDRNAEVNCLRIAKNPSIIDGDSPRQLAGQAWSDLIVMRINLQA